MSTSVVARTINETAEKVGVGKSFLYVQIRTGKLKARKAGKRTLILDSDLNDWISNLPVIDPKNIVGQEDDAE